MRLVGPNCLGVLNTRRARAAERDLRSRACRRPETSASSPRAARWAWRFIELAGDRNLGLSSFASIGNRADITANDLLEYWESDPATDVALLYIESFSDPRRFSRVAPASRPRRSRSWS